MQHLATRTLASLALAISALAALPASAQTNAPAQTSTAIGSVRLTDEQQAYVDRTLETYKNEVDARLARGDITADEAQRLLAWRQWQLAQQIAGTAPPSNILEGQAQGDAQRAATPPPAPYPYYPYYAPWGYGYYAPYAPGPVFYGGICVGGASNNFAGRVCF